jgi:hypothetical protein
MVVPCTSHTLLVGSGHYQLQQSLCFFLPVKHKINQKSQENSKKEKKKFHGETPKNKKQSASYK